MKRFFGAESIIGMRKEIKEFLIIICYISVVINIITPGYLWSIPVIYGAYAVWRILPFKEMEGAERLLLFITNLGITYSITVMVFGIGVWYYPYGAIAMAAVIGLVYHFCIMHGYLREGGAAGIKAVLCGALICVSGLVVAFNVMLPREIRVIFIAGGILLAVKFRFILKERKRVSFLLRKFLNVGKDIKNEY